MLQSFPLVYAIFSGKTQEIYVEFLRFVRNTLQLPYENIVIMTDFEQGLINAVKIIFPESEHQGCYLYFCQVNNINKLCDLQKLILLISGSYKVHQM